MKRALRDNGLAIGFGLLFLGALVGQALVGHADYNQQQLAHHAETVSLLRYLRSSEFSVDVLENWQSEYLQFALFVLGTVWLLQRGSPESKPLDRPGTESDEQQRVGAHAGPGSPAWARAGGWRTALYGNSLLLLMVAIFLLSWLGQSIAGRVAYNAEQVQHHQSTVSWPAYLLTPDFWDRTLQNWQSEFLAVGSIVIFAVYLRQRGSSQSKPVGAADETTATEG